MKKKANAYVKLIESLRRKDFVEANALFADIMTQKAALRLDMEKQRLTESGDKKTKK